MRLVSSALNATSSWMKSALVLCEMVNAVMFALLRQLQLERPIESFFSGLGSGQFRVQNLRVRVRVRVQKLSTKNGTVFY